MPNARRANAPCVLVCESPQTTVMPGSVAPCSGPMTCTMPCRLSQEREIDLGAEAADVGVERLDLQCAKIGIARCLRPSASSACCGRRWRRSSRRATACARRCADLRRPAGWSPHGRGGDRCRAAPCRRPPVDDVAVPQLVVKRARVHGRPCRKRRSGRHFRAFRSAGPEVALSACVLTRQTGLACAFRPNPD